MSDNLLIYIAPLAVAVVAFAALWPQSVRMRDASIVDLFWAPGFLVQMLVAMAFLPPLNARGWVIFGLIAVWSARLSILMIQRRMEHPGEDPRYRMVRESWGEGFWWKSFFIVFLLQPVIQWAIVVGPISGLAAPVSPIGWLASAGIIIAVIGLGLETAADQQLRTFKREAPTGALCTTGLRAHVRHPNYVGEVAFWAGLALVVVEAGAWLGLISPILLAALLIWVSGATLIDERLSATRAGYADYRARVPGFGFAR